MGGALPCHAATRGSAKNMTSFDGFRRARRRRESEHRTGVAAFHPCQEQTECGGGNQGSRTEDDKNATPAAGRGLCWEAWMTQNSSPGASPPAHLKAQPICTRTRQACERRAAGWRAYLWMEYVNTRESQTGGGGRGTHRCLVFHDEFTFVFTQSLFTVVVHDELRLYSLRACIRVLIRVFAGTSAVFHT